MGIADESKPVGVFLFVGPTGVTETTVVGTEFLIGLESVSAPASGASGDAHGLFSLNHGAEPAGPSTGLGVMGLGLGEKGGGEQAEVGAKKNGKGVSGKNGESAGKGKRGKVGCGGA